MHLDIEVGSEPIRGQVSVTGRTSEAFNGWIELTGAIESARAAGAAARTDLDPQPSPEAG